MYDRSSYMLKFKLGFIRFPVTINLLATYVLNMDVESPLFSFTQTQKYMSAIVSTTLTITTAVSEQQIIFKHKAKALLYNL